MKKGFTLIEIMTAVSIFAVVMTIAMGSIIKVFDTNRKSEALKAVMDNLNLSIESMSREMRFSSRYSCGTTTTSSPPSPQNCSGGGSAIAFQTNSGSVISYRLASTTIEKSVNGGAFLPVTAPEISVSNLTFYVLGAIQGDALQPKVLIKIHGTAGSTATTETEFTVQTLVSQRALDIN